jgi:CheY-like chemotaxis protein
MNKPEKRIAIFDDDEDTLSICRFLLEEKEWDVYTFSDCNKIAEKVSTVLPHVILMDNWIPDDGGIMATRRLKNDENLKNIPVVYFSVNSDIELLANHAGAETYLAKPFDPEELDRIINALL